MFTNIQYMSSQNKTYNLVVLCFRIGVFLLSWIVLYFNILTFTISNSKKRLLIGQFSAMVKCTYKAAWLQMLFFFLLWCSESKTGLALPPPVSIWASLKPTASEPEWVRGKKLETTHRALEPRPTHIHSHLCTCISKHTDYHERLQWLPDNYCSFIFLSCFS